MKWYIDLIFRTVRKPLATWLKYRWSRYIAITTVCRSVLMCCCCWVFVCMLVGIDGYTASWPMSVHYSALYQPTNQMASLQGHHLGPIQSAPPAKQEGKECHLISITRKWAGSCWHGSFWCRQPDSTRRQNLDKRISQLCQSANQGGSLPNVSPSYIM